MAVWYKESNGQEEMQESSMYIEYNLKSSFRGPSFKVVAGPLHRSKPTVGKIFILIAIGCMTCFTY